MTTKLVMKTTTWERPSVGLAYIDAHLTVCHSCINFSEYVFRFTKGVQEVMLQSRFVVCYDGMLLQHVHCRIRNFLTKIF